ncbi:MAG: response regulator [Deltaproteobacteria bacterium]|nr:response regulator [Deltaproteobacteria bacterium]
MKKDELELRKRAEEALQLQSDDVRELSQQEMQHLIHELRVHQIELEMQNEELRRIQEALEEARDRYSDLYDFAPIGYFTISKKGMVLEANLRGVTMLGVERGSLIDSPFSRMVSTETQEAFYFHRNKLFETKTMQTCALKLIKKDGTEFHAQLESIVVQDAEGDFSRIRTAVSDITERMRAEEEKIKFEAKSKQVQKMEALGTLAGGVSHDFNNLLMVIQGNVDLMLLDKDSSHPDYKRLESTEQQVKKCAILTNQLLGFARGGKYEVTPANLNDILEKTANLFGRTRKEIVIHPKYHKNIWPVEVDQGQIEQILLNLFINAWHAMPTGGDIYIQTENVRLDKNHIRPYTIEPGKYVKMSITDTGVGMDKATQQRIFEPFFTTKELGSGTGLGLASVYGIIKNHGGSIEVISEKGEGTSFTIYLPASEKGFVKEKEIPEEILRGTETVLIADDEGVVIDIGQQLLKKMGYKVLTARSGKQTVEIYTKNKNEIDIVILDMIMPGMGGGETFDRLKVIKPDIKVLLSSGYSINSRAAEILKRGCNGFIQKPFNIKELSKKLRDILDEK